MVEKVYRLAPSSLRGRAWRALGAVGLRGQRSLGVVQNTVCLSFFLSLSLSVGCLQYTACRLSMLMVGIGFLRTGELCARRGLPKPAEPETPKMLESQYFNIFQSYYMTSYYLILHYTTYILHYIITRYITICITSF